MAGFLTHIAISLVLFFVIFLYSKKWYYGVAGFLGQLMPDVIKFGITGIVIRSFSYREILKTQLFYTLDHYTGYSFAGYFFWAMLVIFVLLFCSVLVYFKFIKKKEASNLVKSTMIFAVCAVIHLIIDLFIIERNPWV